MAIWRSVRGKKKASKKGRCAADGCNQFIAFNSKCMAHLKSDQADVGRVRLDREKRGKS